MQSQYSILPTAIIRDDDDNYDGINDRRNCSMKRNVILPSISLLSHGHLVNYGGELIIVSTYQ